MGDIITVFQESETWKIQLTIAVSFISPKDVAEERVMHWNSNNIKFASYNDANEVVNDFFKSVFSRY